MSPSAWPALPLEQWRDTRDTLQLWLQIIGKVRLQNTPRVNHWWNVPTYLTARGLTTGLMHHFDGEGFQIDIDLQAHRLHITTTSGSDRAMPLREGPVKDFYAAFMDQLDALGLSTKIWPMPVEIPGAIPFTTDDRHTTYHPEHAHRFWLALVRMGPVFEHFRSAFIGKASPIHLFWGALDLATTRFSGRPAPPHPGGAPNCGPHVMLEAYSHEVSSCGYWPDGADEGLFYSYAYPQPPGFAETAVQPTDATWSDELAEFVLPYSAVRAARDPEAALTTFLQTTYAAAANAAHWNRANLERPDTPATTSSCRG